MDQRGESPMDGAAAGDRYVVITADTHVGAEMDTYRDYLEREFLEDYDEWAKSFVYPFEIADVHGGPGSEAYKKNYDLEVRRRDREAEGVVGEVAFPNTIPPFFSTMAFLELDPDGDEARRRSWAGLRAHNRWLADYCNELPGRRAGVA